MQAKGRRLAAAALCVITAAFPGSGGSAAPAAGQGLAIASKLCSNCHAVTPDGGAVRSAAAAATFAEIANRAAQTPERLEGFMLSPPHPTMPQVQLTRDEIAAIAAYILSLRRS